MTIRQKKQYFLKYNKKDTLLISSGSKLNW